MHFEVPDASPTPSPSPPAIGEGRRVNSTQLGHATSQYSSCDRSEVVGVFTPSPSKKRSIDAMSSDGYTGEVSTRAKRPRWAANQELTLGQAAMLCLRAGQLALFMLGAQAYNMVFGKRQPNTTVARSRVARLNRVKMPKIPGSWPVERFVRFREVVSPINPRQSSASPTPPPPQPSEQRSTGNSTTSSSSRKQDLRARQRLNKRYRVAKPTQLSPVIDVSSVTERAEEFEYAIKREQQIAQSVAQSIEDPAPQNLAQYVREHAPDASIAVLTPEGLQVTTPTVHMAIESAPYQPISPNTRYNGKVNEWGGPIGRWAARELADRAKKSEKDKERAERRARFEQLKDAKIDNLIARARQATLETPEERAVRQELTDKKKREEEARKAREEEEKLARIQEAAAKARQEQEERLAAIRQAEEEARAQAEIEAQAEEEIQARARSRRTSREPSAEPTGDGKLALGAHLQPEWMDKLRNVIANAANRPDDVVVTTGRTPIQRKTFARILADGKTGVTSWLDDDAVNGFLNALIDEKVAQLGWRRNTRQGAPYAAIHSGWWQRYVADGDVRGLRNWSRRPGVQGPLLLDAKKIFLPINTGSHWTLIIIDVATKTIEFLDSLGGNGEAEIEAALLWIEQELGNAFKESEWKRGRLHSGRQDNMSDCGVFTCFNAFAAVQGIPSRAVIAAKMPSARRQMAAVLLNGGFTGEFEL